MHEPLPIASVPAVSPPAAMSFGGERREFGKLVSRGALLELVTLGFYRFWLATDMRRHLWSRTSAGGDSAEYTGTAKELLIGFLVAMAVLVPVYLAYFLIGLEAERLQAYASIPLVLFFVVFTQFAMYRARRYRLTRTVWRGLRFSMGGSGWDYAWRSVLWGLLVIVTAGLALPWRSAALERFKMRYTSYGDLQGSFAGTGRDLFRRAWWLWLLAWPAAMFVFPLPFLYAIFKAIEWRWWISGLRFGDVRFESDLDAAALMGVYWKVIGWLVVLALCLGAWFAAVYGAGASLIVVSGSMDQQIAAVVQHPAILIAFGLGYLMAAVALNAVIRIYLMRDVWAKVAATTVIHNLAAADNVSGQGDAVGALGEGFADSLDVGGF